MYSAISEIVAIKTQFSNLYFDTHNTAHKDKIVLIYNILRYSLLFLLFAQYPDSLDAKDG